jgi:hypothetical protein
LRDAETEDEEEEANEIQKEVQEEMEREKREHDRVDNSPPKAKSMKAMKQMEGMKKQTGYPSAEEKENDKMTAQMDAMAQEMADMDKIMAKTGVEDKDPDMQLSMDVMAQEMADMDNSMSDKNQPKAKSMKGMKLPRAELLSLKEVRSHRSICIQMYLCINIFTDIFVYVFTHTYHVDTFISIHIRLCRRICV